MPKNHRKRIVQSEDPFVICIVSAAPLRSKPFHSLEMKSQILFGEMGRIIDRKGKHWYKIACEWDDFTGWIDSKQVFRIDQKVFEKNLENPAFALDLVNGVLGDKMSIPICIGSTLPRYDGMSLKMPIGKMTYSGQVIFANEQEINESRIIKLGMKYIHAPYLWGGRSPFGIDGSGLIQMIFKLAGFRFPRNARMQINLGMNVDFPNDARPSDLAFFEDTKGNIVHVGMIVEENKILHAHGRVRIDYFDHHGIFNEDIAKYTHKLRIIKRIDVTEKLGIKEDLLSFDNN